MLPSTQSTVSASRRFCFRGSIPSLCAPLSTLHQRPSRASAHDSGTVWFAIPSLAETYTLYSLPVSRRTLCQINFCRARSAERNTRSRCGNRISPLIRRLGSEDPERRTRDEMALKVEGVVNGGMHAEEALGGAS